MSKRKELIPDSVMPSSFDGVVVEPQTRCPFSTRLRPKGSPNHPQPIIAISNSIYSSDKGTIDYFYGMIFSKAFIRFNWLTLVFIYLVVVAGSFVRITGSGMGCPDWPTCFGQWVPPTEVSQLPENYKNVYAENRAKKIEKFAKVLKVFGMNETADQLLNDPNLRIEQSFNSRKTWTEYVNRLFGFLAGNAMLLSFIWLIWKYRKRKLIIVSGVNLVLMAFQAWFGSIVVASNLVPWTITVHMFLALVIIGLQLFLLYSVSSRHNTVLAYSKSVKYVLWICFLITFYQMFLGTQVRESIDELTLQGFGREQWVNELGMPFFIHRSFSWLVLVLLTFLAYYNEKNSKYNSIRIMYGLLILELVSGILLAYSDMPGLVQTSHLIFATVIFGILTMLVFRSRSVTSRVAH